MRLLKTDEFSSVFRCRSLRRSAHFVLYMRPREHFHSPIVRAFFESDEAKFSKTSLSGIGEALMIEKMNESCVPNIAHVSLNMGRIGIVIGKKHAPCAVTRNLIKRQAREMFRRRSAELAGWDFVLRLACRFDKGAYEAAGAPVLKTWVKTEFEQLFSEVLDRACCDKPA
ncbi:ribonuclease P protein component [Candidatus Pandoraea novymonadis]|uniref:Ribonuclease P protein component n=1 Tax=Candidatus Pandoraea novymonadis TaxID=1808959 RepID=A0ABX5FFG8_9BURK|nr:ribonuclease P protein component [Candidatus Pandoraea novymonadis]PSB92414.1 Ribonuclease P protein component [Candidatus Pandoraea novymonadis]